MILLEKIDEEIQCGVKFYIARNKVKLTRHKLVLVDLISIADVAGLTIEEVLKAVESNQSIKESVHLVMSHDGAQRNKAIRVGGVSKLFQHLHMTTGGNPMVRTGRTIIEHAIQLAEREMREIHAN